MNTLDVLSLFLRLFFCLIYLFITQFCCLQFPAAWRHRVASRGSYEFLFAQIVYLKQSGRYYGITEIRDSWSTYCCRCTISQLCEGEKITKTDFLWEEFSDLHFIRTYFVLRAKMSGKLGTRHLTHEISCCHSTVNNVPGFSTILCEIGNDV